MLGGTAWTCLLCFALLGTSCSPLRHVLSFVCWRSRFVFMEENCVWLDGNISACRGIRGKDADPSGLLWLLAAVIFSYDPYKLFPQGAGPRCGWPYTVTQCDAIEYLCQTARISGLLVLPLFYELPEDCVGLAIM